MSNKITVIGSGPGGYEAAIMASKLGADVTIIEKAEIGGTCLNQGCIPTKIFLASANLFSEALEFNEMGIDIDSISLNYPQILYRKEKNINQLKKGIIDLFKNNNITYIPGTAKILDKNTIEITDNNSIQILNTDKIILATGSKPILPESFNYNGKNILNSNDILNLEKLPKSIIIIGGNIVAVELGQYLSRFGVQVTIIESQNHLLPQEDSDVSRQLLRKFKKEKIKVITKTLVKEIIDKEDHVDVITDKKIFSAQMAIICIGREPNNKELGLENIPIELDNNSFIKVNDKLQTNIDNIYAIGDLINSSMLAHVASHEGIIAAENANNKEVSIRYDAIPHCIYTEPEIATVGVKEEELKEKNIKYKKGLFYLKSLGKSLALNKKEGFVKILTNEDDVIIGATIVGARACDQIMELVLAIELKLTARTLGKIIHPHPTLSEGILEACRDVNNESINKIS